MSTLDNNELPRSEPGVIIYVQAKPNLIRVFQWREGGKGGGQANLQPLPCTVDKVDVQPPG
jgi:hypothetical protein